MLHRPSYVASTLLRLPSKQLSLGAWIWRHCSSHDPCLALKLGIEGPWWRKVPHYFHIDAPMTLNSVDLPNRDVGRKGRIKLELKSLRLLAARSEGGRLLPGTEEFLMLVSPSEIGSTRTHPTLFSHPESRRSNLWFCSPLPQV